LLQVSTSFACSTQAEHRLPAPIQRTCAAPALTPSRTGLPPPSRASNRHCSCRLGCRPPAAVDLLPQSVPDQGEEPNELPSSSSLFCPTSWPSPWPGSPAPLPPPPVGLPFDSLLCSVQRRKKAIFPITPFFIFFSTRGLPLFVCLTVSLRAPGFLKFFTNRSLAL
jgi:hypothetical protein